MTKRSKLTKASIIGILFLTGTVFGLELAGTTVTPHNQSANMRYRRSPDPELGARIELFLHNETEKPFTISPDFAARFDGKTPQQLLDAGDWAWHDTPQARKETTVTLGPDAMTVWHINSRRTNWGIESNHSMEWELAGVIQKQDIRMDNPKSWISAITFLGNGVAIQPDRMVVHIANRSSKPLSIQACRLWLPSNNADFLQLHPQPWLTELSPFPADGIIAENESGGFAVRTGSLPLSYAAVEIKIAVPDGTESRLWAHLRIKREVFDISGGWTASNINGRNTLTMEAYLRTLKRMHINTAHTGPVSGYADKPDLYNKYPLKMFNRLEPVSQFDTDMMLPKIHAVEFLGEPQYGGGRPVPPQEVWLKLSTYQSTRLPTTVTHSEERVWRYYAGLSDYPHYDAYRVTAPAPDSWSAYDRWNGQRIRWGAPLETIGDMTRSLRDLYRPVPIAYWSQGAHHDWDSAGGRKRTSPTPDELRAQAYHALANRITSLYWFNLSLKSLAKFRDLIEPITRVDREILLIEPLLLSGNAYEYRRQLQDGKLGWDLSSVTGPDGGLFFANDLTYEPDPEEKVFRFKPSRPAVVSFRLPVYLSRPAEVFRIDADGTHDVQYRIMDRSLEFSDSITVAGIYVASPTAGLRAQIQQKYAELLKAEQSYNFDPAKIDADFEQLTRLLSGGKP